MGRSRGRPTPSEWEAIKPEFNSLYLEHNLTLKAVRDLFATRGFNATLRQYKTKVNAWGYDLKKIKRPTWHSMLLVMKDRQNRGETSAFIVPVRGSGLTVVRSDKIQKEAHRNRSVFDSSDLERAKAILQRAGVHVCIDDDSAIREYQASLHQDGGTLTSELDLASQNNDVSDSIENYFGDDQIDHTSPALTDSDRSFSMTGPSSTEPIPGSHSRPSALASASTARLAGWLGNTHRTWPQIENSSYDGSLDRSSVSQPYVYTIHDFDAMTAIHSLLLDPSCNDQHHQIPLDILQSRDLERLRPYIKEDLRLAARWARPYLRSFSERRDLPVQLDDLGREDAKIALREMLDTCNRYILLLCHWMTTVFASSNQSVLLAEFSTDCCTVFDRHGHARTYGGQMHLVLALNGGRPEEIEDCRAQFMQSTDFMFTIWTTNSPPYLINRHYRAWLLLDQKQHREAEDELRRCLPVSEQLMGHRHLVTINCLAMLSRCLAEMENVSEAMDILQDALNRLQDCHKYLYAYHDRLSLRMADFHTQSGEWGQAEGKLSASLKFRRSHFGMNSSATWYVIDKLQYVLRLQGKMEEAHLIRQSSQEQFDQEHQQRRLYQP